MPGAISFDKQDGGGAYTKVCKKFSLELYPRENTCLHINVACQNAPGDRIIAAWLWREELDAVIVL